MKKMTEIEILRRYRLETALSLTPHGGIGTFTKTFLKTGKEFLSKLFPPQAQQFLRYNALQAATERPVSTIHLDPQIAFALALNESRQKFPDTFPSNKGARHERKNK